MSFMKVVGGVAGLAGGASMYGWARKHRPREGLVENLTARIDGYVLGRTTFHIALASAIVLVLSGLALTIRGLTED